MIYQRTPGTLLTRQVSIDSSNNVWVSGWDGGAANPMHKLDGNTGAILMTVSNLPAGGYGALVDGNGILWAAGCETSSVCSSSPRAKVINLSVVGTTESATLKAAVDKAWSRGVVVACAAGNISTSAKHYPATYPNCIAVAATDHNDQKATFSNFGSAWVDVAAPGVNILSTAKSGSYEAWYGTSFATPHVSGLAGLLWSTNSTATGMDQLSYSAARHRNTTTIDSTISSVALLPARISWYDMPLQS